MPALLEVRQLGVRRGGDWIFRGLDMRLEAGEAMGVMGPSGAGKTTFAWTLLGLLEPEEGAVHLEGQPWSGVPEAQRRPRRHRLQAVFQDPATSLPPHRTGWEILAEPLAIHRRDLLPRARELCQAMAERVKFPEACLDQRPSQWSVGLAQRLALGRALMVSPRGLVVDEPLSALDATLAGHLLHLLLELKAEGVGLVFVSHDPRAVARLCDQSFRL